ncbi:hypothetical protein [Streptomyces sp. TM32]|uniref:hypothetical protein n=1 Tax=Streptomyces sp. TM32 TaxID=1652669 RepID=UPI0020B1568C|nr:hypothetical protein [Streptomyces sp. TM32]
MTGMINGPFHLLPQAEKRQGGMSEVRKAVDVLSPEGAYAAVKLLKRRDDEESTRIFLDRETASLRALTHPNIVRMLDCVERNALPMSASWEKTEMVDKVRSTVRPEGCRYCSQPRILWDV